jgi:hypothetical protein
MAALILLAAARGSSFPIQSTDEVVGVWVIRFVSVPIFDLDSGYLVWDPAHEKHFGLVFNSRR